MPEVMAKTLFAYIFYDFASICDILYRKIRSVCSLSRMVYTRCFEINGTNGHETRFAKEIIFYSL